MLYKSFPNIGRDGKLSDRCNETNLKLNQGGTNTKKAIYQGPGDMWQCLEAFLVVTTWPRRGSY